MATSAETIFVLIQNHKKSDTPTSKTVTRAMKIPRQQNLKTVAHLCKLLTIIRNTRTTTTCIIAPLITSATPRKIWRTAGASQLV